jgi:ATP-dependent Clp protease ATP-binding subunit ClpA
VIHLYEIEKAHPDVWNILLQVMDHGFLTDSNGRKADFRNAILILTSNVGSREMERRPLGMSNETDTSGQSKKEVERVFTPEFRNRLDAIVIFKSLDPVAVGQVVGRQLMELESQLLARRIELEVSSDVREWLAHHGYDPKMGARPMGRLVQERIKRPLSEEILFGKLEGGGRVRISLKDSADPRDPKAEFQFEITPASATTASPAPVS